MCEIEAYLKELARQSKLFPPEAPVHSRLALEAGIEQYRACARWARGMGFFFHWIMGWRGWSMRF